MDEFSPLEALEHSFQRWWLVALFIIGGGVIGWLIHFVQPPLYDAKVTFTAMVDFKQAGPITTLEQDHSINVIGDIFLKDNIEGQVIADAQAAGIKLTQDQLNNMAYVERRSEVWELRIRDSNPQVAQTVANFWADRVFAALKADNQHARLADSLTQQLNVLSLCMQQIYLPDSLSSLCTSTSPTDISTKYQQVLGELNNEQLASGGLASWVLFDLKQKAVLPTQPVSYNVNTMVLAGGLIGFILGIWMVVGRLPELVAGIISKHPRVLPPGKDGKRPQTGGDAGSSP